MTTKYQSKKGFTLVEIMIVVVIIGLIVTMAVPSYKKIRATAQNKGVVNNIRQITSAADQYFLEKGVVTVDIAALMGPGGYIKGESEASLLVANEDYDDEISMGSDYMVTGLPAGVGGNGVNDLKPTAGSTELIVGF